MGPACGKHDDQYRRDEAFATELRAANEFGVELEPIGAVLAGTVETVERLHRTWDAGLRDAVTRLDEIRVQVDEAVRRARVLVDRRPSQ